MKCKKCDAELSPEAVFCPMCGAPVTESETTTDSEEEVEPTLLMSEIEDEINPTLIMTTEDLSATADSGVASDTEESQQAPSSAPDQSKTSSQGMSGQMLYMEDSGSEKGSKFPLPVAIGIAVVIILVLIFILF